MNLLRILLFPFAIMYGIIMHVRNKMFDWGLLKSECFDVPVISVGNITTGGTGKTPHVEYLIDMLSSDYKVAVLSRGYKRATKGYHEATPQTTVADIGDEPFQFYNKYNNIVIAVDEKRRRGIKKILKNHPETKIILLDDAFQHRYIKPKLNILLTNYRNLFTNDYIVPTGNLRESRRGAKRANTIIVTKTPRIFSPIDKDLILNKLKHYTDKTILFSYIDYGQLEPVTPACKKKHPQKIKSIVILTGIANPASLEERIKRISDEQFFLKYPDHHKYSKKDINKIVTFFNEIFSGDKAIVTTEKDLMRLKDPGFMKMLSKVPLYYMPIKIRFHNSDKTEFLNKIKSVIPEK